MMTERDHVENRPRGRGRRWVGWGREVKLHLDVKPMTLVG